MIRRLAGLAVTLTAVALLVASTAAGQTALVTDYVNYPDTPQAELPDGCDASGVTGVSFTLNGGAAVGSLSAFGPLQAGDAVTMAWQTVSGPCDGVPVVLVVKDAPLPFFDPGVNQPAVTPYAATTATGPGSVTLTLPDLSGFGHQCAYQVDAIVGLPLAVVGPDGSFYSASTRGDDRRTTLISAANGAYPECAPLEATTTTGATTTTMPSSTTTAPASTTTDPTTTTSLAPAVAPARAEIPVTGTRSWPVTLAGLVGIVGGLALTLATRRKGTA